MKKLLSTLAVATALTTGAQAGAIVDLKAGFNYHLGVTPTGAMDAYDIPGTLGVDSTGQTSMYLEFDHLIPIVPNVKYEQNTLSYSGTATQSIVIGGQTFTANAASTFSWDNQDVILYWGVPFSTWIPMIDAADFGFGVKLGDMVMGIEGVSTTAFPIGAIYGYGRLHVSPPMLFGLGFELEAKAISGTAEGVTMSYGEYNFKADWMIEAPIPVIDLELGVELGYRTISYEISAGGVAFDLGFSGVYLGVVGKFGI